MKKFNRLDEDEAKAALTNCCGASKWVNLMLKKRPFSTQAEMLTASKTCWEQCGEADWKEAFTHHPKIGDLTSSKKKNAATSELAECEEAIATTATPKILRELAKGNVAYEVKFGYIFMVSATGKNAKEMLDVLTNRIHNSPKKELLIAKDELYKITRIRINKLLN